MLVQVASPLFITLFDVLNNSKLLYLQGSEESNITPQVSLSRDESFLVCTGGHNKRLIAVYSLLPPRPSADFGVNADKI